MQLAKQQDPLFPIMYQIFNALEQLEQRLLLLHFTQFTNLLTKPRTLGLPLPFVPPPAPDMDQIARHESTEISVRLVYIRSRTARRSWRRWRKT